MSLKRGENPARGSNRRYLPYLGTQISLAIVCQAFLFLFAIDPP